MKSKRLWLAIALNALAFFMVIFRPEAALTVKIWYSVMGFDIVYCGFESKYPHKILQAGTALLPFVSGETQVTEDDNSDS